MNSIVLGHFRFHCELFLSCFEVSGHLCEVTDVKGEKRPKPKPFHHELFSLLFMASSNGLACFHSFLKCMVYKVRLGT